MPQKILDYKDTVSNLTHQLYNAPLYYFIKFKLQNRDIWVQYYKGERKEYNYVLNGEEDTFANTPNVKILVKKEGTNYDVYRYNGLVAIQRKNENGVFHDAILNLLEIETTISSFLNELEKEHSN